jgi:hypothetical protein
MILIHHQYLSKTEKKTELILCHTREEADVLFERLKASDCTIQVEMLLAARVRDFRSYTDVPDSDQAILNAGLSNSDSATLTHPTMDAAIACANVECGFTVRSGTSIRCSLALAGHSIRPDSVLSVTFRCSPIACWYTSPYPLSRSDSPC